MQPTRRTSHSRPAARSGLGALLVALGAIHAGIVAGATTACPPSLVHLEHAGPGPFPVSDPIYDSTYVGNMAVSAHVAFDRPSGRMSLTAASSGRLIASVRVVERFDVTGVPAGTHVAATMEFRLDGWSQNNCGGAGCGVRLEGTLVVAPDSVTADADQPGPGNSRKNLAATLSLPVTFVAGSPIEAQFFLDYGTGPGGNADAEVVGSYRVSGLPGGVRAIACDGADVTPVRRATWGALKSIYR